MANIAIDVRRVNHFGFGTYLRNILRSLARLDQINRYLLVGWDDNGGEELPANFVPIPYRVSERSPRNIYALHLLLRRHRAQVFHVPHYHWIPQSLPCPYVVTIHDLVEFIYPPGRRSQWLSASMFSLVRRSLRGAARLVAVSHATRRDLMRVFAIPPERVDVVYNGIDERFLQGHASEAERQFIAERYAIHYPFILYAGRVQRHKNIEKLIEAFAALKAELNKLGVYTDLKLIIIGDELSKHPHLRRTVIRSRIENDVRFLGFVPIESLRIFYDVAKVFAFPSRYEGFGMPPLEAMAHGTPVVTSNTSSLPEVVDQAALLVNPENVFDIMRGLRQALLDAPARERLKALGYRQVQQFSWDDAARRMIQIYGETADAHAPRNHALTLA